MVKIYSLFFLFYLKWELSIYILVIHVDNIKAQKRSYTKYILFFSCGSQDCFPVGMNIIFLT